MNTDGFIPKDMLKRFAVVKLWPELKTAEDECIARLKLAAGALGVECIEIHSDGRLISDPSTVVSKRLVDFVLHLHFDTPKNYDAFSFVALWNPIKFYHEWGYYRCSRNLVTHDDFISCSSSAADDHVNRMVRRVRTHLSPRFHLYHSTPDIIHGPSLGERKLAYAGINWDALRGGRSRHQEMLKKLDSTGHLRIYGPTIFQGVKVWDGYQSYVKEVPFDGVSMIDEIAKAGISLVLSSQAHKDSALMSNRLFESIAAGALVICDENPFAMKHFGDSLLYVDTRGTADATVAEILKHLDWTKNNPEAALAKINRTQELFREKFSLIRNLSDLYTHFEERKNELSRHHFGEETTASINVRLNLLMPTFSAEVLLRHLGSATRQSYTNLQVTLWVDQAELIERRSEIEELLIQTDAQFDVVGTAFFDRPNRTNLAYPRAMGQVIGEIIRHAASSEAVIIVAPNETLLSNHVEILAAALQRDESVKCAATAAILNDGTATVHSVSDLIDFGHVDASNPIGYGRFIFRLSGISDDVHTALPYLHGRPLAVLRGESIIHQQFPATVSIDLKTEFPKRTWDDIAETEVIRSFSPYALTPAVGMAPVNTAIQLVPFTSSIRLGQLFSAFWWQAQYAALRRQGFQARLRAAKRRLLG
ncbi:hypothetical protein ASF69_13825 [Rhizobium sp. Leaf311]|uniref:glycosyltransferase family protein n=1 Tax=Rhizobium sp. Leaf311 TaxID=1736332 RepID=UPI0007140605|nr:hypothetical protein [Rhizobium sp. Leaf311]KQQ58469.1 hypothetical protein ASF69_13825 [Rhizobium sp. Leaf311]